MRSIADTAEERWIGTQMIDRERVIKGLQCCVRSDSEAECPTECPYYRKCWEDDYPDGKLALSLHKDTLELLREQPAKDTNVLGKWISVKKKLPEQTGCYQVYRPNFWGEYGGQICVCYWDGKYWCDSYEGAGADGFELSPGDVSHWMPLPEPPGVKQDD